MKLALLQTYAVANRDQNLARIEPLLASAGQAGVDVLVLPELFAVQFVPGTPDPGYFVHAESMDGPSNTLARGTSTDGQMVVMSSFFERSPVDGVYHNTVAVFDHGELIGCYRKAHLPFSHAFPEKYYFQPGSEPPLVLQTSAAKLGVIICYERHYPELTRAAALGGAQILCIPVAAASASMADVYQLELRAHAVANAMFVVAPNRIGREADKEFFGGSVIYGPDGSTVAMAEDTGEDELLVAEIDISDVQRARLDRPFLRDRRPELYQSLTATELPRN